MKFEPEFKHFHWRKYIWKCCLGNVSHFSWPQCVNCPLPGTRPTNGILIKFKIWSKFVVIWYKMGSQWNFAVLLSWREQNFVVIAPIYYNEVHYKFSLNSKFDQNVISGTDARSVPLCPGKQGYCMGWLFNLGLLDNTGDGTIRLCACGNLLRVMNTRCD